MGRFQRYPMRYLQVLGGHIYLLEGIVLRCCLTLTE